MNTSSTKSFLAHSSFAAASNKHELFNHLYDNYAAALYGTILTWNAKEEVAQNILQQVFEAYLQQDVLDNHSEPRPFIAMLKLARRQYNQHLTIHTNTSSNIYSPVEMEVN